MNLKSELDPDKLHIIPFGGCGEFGMNMTAYILKKKLFLVDVGLLFPDQRKLGVSSIIPSIDKFIDSFGKVEAYLITHGHEDHIGALPYIYRRWPAPIYATPWTCGLIKKKFEEKRLSVKHIRKVLAGQTVKAPPLSIRYIHVNHSIPDACALWIQSEHDSVFHTGDFKIDPKPVGTRPINLKELEKIGQAGVDLLIADSTNAQSPGPSPAESSVIKPLEKLIRQADGRVILTTFASNLWRLKLIADICKRLGKKVLVSGRGIHNCYEMGVELKLFRWPEGILINESQLKNIPDRKVVILSSGSQGEFRSSLYRIANQEHRAIRIKSGDTVIFSARIIPGNERSILTLTDLLRKQGAHILTTRHHPEIHVSGHAYEDDLKKVLRLLRPKHYLPVHGTFSHLKANAELGEKLNYRDGRHTLIENGDILRLYRKRAKIVGHVDISQQYVDQDSHMPMSWETLRERLRIGEFGLAIISGVFSKKRERFTAGPDLFLQGIPNSPEESLSRWTQKASLHIQGEIEKWLDHNDPDEEKINHQCCLILRRLLSDHMKKNPVIIPQVYMI